MTDASLVRVLARQTRHKVGLVALKQVQAGSAALRAALDKLATEGVRHVVVDAVADTDLGIIGEAVGDDLLVTGGSGVALGLPAAYRRRGLLAHKANADTLPKIAGAAAVLAGSCSAATLGQIAAFKGPHLHLDTDAIARGEAVVDTGTRLGQGQARQRADPALGQREPGRGQGAAGEIRRREIEPRHREDHGGAGQGPGRRRRRRAWSWPAARPRAPWSARST